MVQQPTAVPCSLTSVPVLERPSLSPQAVLLEARHPNGLDVEGEGSSSRPFGANMCQVCKKQKLSFGSRRRWFFISDLVSYPNLFLFRAPPELVGAKAGSVLFVQVGWIIIMPYDPLVRVRWCFVCAAFPTPSTPPLLISLNVGSLLKRDHC